MSADELLATYGTWNLPAFLEQVPDRAVHVVVLCVLSDRRDDAGREAIGREVRRLWTDMTSRLPSAHGHRLSWSDVAFLVDGGELEDLVQTLRELSTPHDAVSEVWFAVDPVARARDGRLPAIEALVMGIHKIGYRKTYPAAWCGCNGRLVNRVD